MALLTALSTFLLSRRFTGKERAVLSSAVFLTTWTVLFGYSTKCEPDMAFTFFVFSSIAAWYSLYKRGMRKLAWFSGYFLTSLAFLTKGIPAIAFFLTFAVSALFVEKDIKELFSLNSFFGLLGLFPALIWFLSIPYERALPALMGEVSSRSVLSYSLIKSLKGIASFPFRYILALFPWSLTAGYVLFKDREILKPLLEENFLKFILTGASVNSLMYMLSPGTRLRYLLPLFPFIAILFSAILSEVEIDRKRAEKIVQALLDLLLILGILSGLIIMGDDYHLVIYTILFLLVGYFIRFFALKRLNGGNLIILTALSLLLLRDFYSSYFIPIAQFRYPKVREVARRIAEDTEGMNLETTTSYLQLCFYIEKFRGKPLKLVKVPEKGSLYLSMELCKKALKEYKLGKHSFYICVEPSEIRHIFSP